MTIKIPGHHLVGDLAGPSWEEFAATHRSPRTAVEVVSALREDFYVPEPLRKLWNIAEPNLRLEIAATHLQFLPSRSLGAMQRILARLDGESESSFSKVIDTLVRGTGDSEGEVSRFEEEIGYRMEVQLYARRGCRVSGSAERGPFNIRQALFHVELVRGECVRASCYLELLRRAVASENLAASRGEVAQLDRERLFSRCEAGTLSVIARGCIPFSVDEDSLLLNLAASHHDTHGRVLWGEVVKEMHRVFPERQRSAAVYQQRRYKLL